MELVGDILEKGFRKDIEGYESNAFSESTNCRLTKTWHKNTVSEAYFWTFTEANIWTVSKAYFFTVPLPGRWVVLVSTVKLVWSIQLAATTQV